MIGWRRQAGIVGASVLALVAAAGASVSESDVVIVSPADVDVAVFVDGVRGGKCESARPYAGRGSVAIGNFVTATPDCPPGLVVFGRGRGMYYEHPFDIWTDGPGDDIPVTLPQPIRVELNVVVATGSAADVMAAADDVSRASELFDLNRVGIAIVGTPRVAAAGSVFGDGCMAVNEIRKLKDEYRPERLNVYYVKTVNTPDAEELYGLHCASFGAPEIIFISTGDHTTTTLAHELGHAFGLQVPNDGHTNDVSGFASGNLMWFELSVEDSNDRESFTAGQAFRMNVDGRSWLNRVPYPAVTGATTPPRLGYVLDCQDTQSTGPCPRLKAGWP